MNIALRKTQSPTENVHLMKIMAYEQSKMGSVCFIKGSFYLAWFISPRTSPCLVCRIAGYVTRMSGGVGGRSAMGVPIPIEDSSFTK